MCGLSHGPDPLVLTLTAPVATNRSSKNPTTWSGQGETGPIRPFQVERQNGQSIHMSPSDNIKLKRKETKDDSNSDKSVGVIERSKKTLYRQVP